jgi:hypothetical protein
MVLGDETRLVLLLALVATFGLWFAVDSLGTHRDGRDDSNARGGSGGPVAPRAASGDSSTGSLR